MADTDPPSPGAPDGPDGPVAAALRAVLRPLARLAVARAVGLGALQTILKGELVRAAQGLAAPAPSQSRIALMTGVHRKDVRDILAGGLPGGAPPRASISETVAARWLADPRRRAEGGAPAALPRGGPAGFDALVASVSKDVRPRAVLDDMLRLGLVAETAAPGDEDDDPRVALLSAAATPATGDRQLSLFAENLSDHAAAGVGNLLAAAEAPRRLERAVFYDHLSEASVEALERAAREQGQAALETLNALAAELQARDVAEGVGDRRFRFGVYFHAAPQADDPQRDEGGAS
ncbi:MAG: DUF6502 family protein [Pseudomonadota bacterium]